MDEVEVVVAHHERATLRVGDVFVKVVGDEALLDREIEAMTAAPVPTPELLWRRPRVFALAALPGTAIARLGRPSTASRAAWVAAGETVRRLHDAPVPDWSSPRDPDLRGELERECARLVDDGILPRHLVGPNREIALAVLRPWEPVFVHGDLQVAHVFVDGDRVTGLLDWSDGGPGDPMHDLAVLTLGHRDRLEAVAEGYGPGVDLDAVRGWWSMRSLLAVRWLVEHGFDPFLPGCEVDVLRAQL